MKHKKKVLICANSSSFLNERISVINGLKSIHGEVEFFAPYDEKFLELAGSFTPFMRYPLPRSISVLRDLHFLLLSSCKFFTEQYAVVFCYNPKVILLLGLACRLTGTPFVANFSGLGSVMIQGGWKAGLVEAIYRYILKNSNHVFFQNTEDRDYFKLKNILHDNHITHILPGSGVNLSDFERLTNVRKSSPKFQLLFVGRLIRQKGIEELYEAIKSLDDALLDLHIAGDLDHENPSCISQLLFEELRDLPNCTIHGQLDRQKIPILLSKMDALVLPSYREGLPRAVLESFACRVPVIATDVVGVRSICVNRENSILCEAKSASSLKNAIKEMISLPLDVRKALGDNGYRLVANSFQESKVVSIYSSVCKTYLD